MKKAFLKTVLLACLPVAGWAQTPVSMNEAVAEALKNNPLVKSNEFEFEAQRALRKTSFDWGKTNVTFMTGQFNSVNRDNNVTISQTIPFPLVSANEARYNKAQTESTKQNLAVEQNDLAYQVKTSYTSLQYILALQRLLQSQDTLYSNFAKAAALRYKTGETNLLEKTTAETQWMEIQNQLQLNAREVSIERTHLQTLLHSDKELVPSETLVRLPLPQEGNTSTLLANPQLQFWKSQTEVARAAKQTEHSRFLPDITVGYFNQSLTGFQRIGNDEVYFDRSKRFTGWTLGVSLPIWFLPQAGRSQFASLQEAASQKKYESFQRQLEGQFEQALKELEKNQSNLDYYEKSATVNAQLILKQSQKAYQSGEIGYVEYLQSLKNAYAIQSNHLQALHQYNLSVLAVEYLSGKK